MKSDSVINFLQYILGMFFNLAIMAIVGYAVFALTIAGFNWGTNFAYEMVAVGPNQEFIFVLDEDTPASEVSRQLEYKGIINSSRLFNLELFLMGRIRTYRAGTYTLNSNMTNTEVHRTFLRTGSGQAPHETITIPEGWTIDDMAAYFEYRGFFTADEFIYTAHYMYFGFSFLLDIPSNRPNGLEGYLFPDTYQIPVNPRPGDIIVRMLRRFDEIFNDDLREQAYNMGLTMDDVVIMASIIEVETRIAQERPIVSQVIHNRLAINMPLQMCSTVQYVLDEQRDRLTNADLQINSPFNTYLHSGLPIGPISNPGAAAIRAVLNPSGDSYLFFVLYNFQTGEHFFSNTAAEHNAADARARQREQEGR